MALSQFRSKVKATGGLYNKIRKKKKRDFGSDFIPVKIGKSKVSKIRTFGGNKKLRVIQANHANVTDPETGKTQKTKIIQVKENPANPFFVRQNIVTKGSVIETELGLAKVISRPGQDGVVNAVKIEKK